jgi:hypothetical protein
MDLGFLSPYPGLMWIHLDPLQGQDAGKRQPSVLNTCKGEDAGAGWRDGYDGGDREDL